MTGAVRRDHALGAEKEDEAAESAVVFREGRDPEALERELVVSLVVEADFVEVCYQVPVAFQVDGVAERLIDGGQLAAGERPIQRVARPLAFQGRDVFGRPSATEKRPRAASANLPSTWTGRLGG